MKISLGTRLLTTASLVMAIFFGVTGVVIERAYQESVDASLQQRLNSFATMLIAASEPGIDGGVRIVHPVPEPRFFLQNSGLYARMIRNDGARVWHSPSTDQRTIDFPRGLTRGASRIDNLVLADGVDLRAFSIGVSWSGEASVNETFTISVAEDITGFNAQIAGFRRTLWGWLLVVAIALLAVQWMVLRWGLTPLRRVTGDIAAIEAGRISHLEGEYPPELRRLTDNLNALVTNEREQRERSRRALGDLAHSLKTPLAILRGVAEAPGDSAFRDSVQTEVGRMTEIVDYQLRRAATAGRSIMRASIPVEPAVRKVVDALGKARHDKEVRCIVNIAPELRFHGDQEDLLELLGNLLDNAWKWCRARVVVEGHANVTPGQRDGLCLVIEDDGPGIPDAVTAEVFERGARVDESREGHGIGLAIVRDIVAVYEGSIKIGRSDSGGARITVIL